MSYYSETAYTAAQDVHNHQLDRNLSDSSEFDVRQLPLCEEYDIRDNSVDMVAPREMLEKQIAREKGFYKQYLQVKINSQCYYYYKGMDNLWVFIYLYKICKAMAKLFLFLFFLVLITFNLRTKGPFEWLDFFYFFLLPSVIFYAGEKYCGYRAMRCEDECNFTFDRQTGKVFVKYPKRSHEVLFKDFYPSAKLYHKPNGGMYHEVYMVHRYKHFVIEISKGSLAKGIVEYHFLKHFMDINRPLPDIPELECYRHLDPTTKKHDEETNRETMFWGEKTGDQYKVYQKQARARAVEQLGKKMFLM